MLRFPDRLDQLVVTAAENWPDATALVGQDGESLTYRDLSARAHAVADDLLRCGVERGSAVLVAVGNAPADVAAQVGVWLCGAVAVPVHRSSPPLVVEDVATRTAACALVDNLRSEWFPDGEVDTPEHGVRRLQQAGSAHPAELDEDQALVIFTSGSTGRPKGVVLSHRAFCRKLEAIDSVLAFAPGTSLLQVLHLHFSFGQWTTLLTLATGGTVHLVPRFTVAGMTEALARFGIHRTAVVPTMLRKLLAESDESALMRLRAVGAPRLWIAGGEPLAAGLGLGLTDLLPHARITDVFGLSETCTSDFIVAPEAYRELAGSIGFPSAGVAAKVVGDDGRDAPAGEVAELWIRTPFRMTGYLGDPAATAAATAGEWFRTGDLARRGDDGRFVLAGRAKNIISRGGNKISPLEVEGVYAGHPACAAVVATGVPDDLLGERTVLLVTLRHDARVDGAALREWGRQQMDRFKLPDEVHVIDELPLGPTGKVDRVGVQRMARERGLKRTRQQS
ncbi:class I adenylate-forming enzyme family protein [Streptomyces sp. NPDC051219]|uniref:class I adenylate-forming enzyme family protein n=1 Tax=Streptomyces sp. NPDC051219 TaxID=3155283 RepID=UPI003432424D